MPPTQDFAELLRDDLASARKIWLESQPKDPPADFLLPENAAGETLDFHALRHTCGAWLAIAGVSPKVIQTIIRLSTIMLTLDTYGHLLPGDTEAAASKLAKLLSPVTDW